VRVKYYWIKQRHNPQLGTYYVPQGALPIKDAKAMERSIYGDNVMLRYASKEAYETAVRMLTGNQTP
jgi:hypothetical protein